MKIPQFAFLLLSIILLFSCKTDVDFKTPASTLKLDQKIMVNGIEREYHIQTPSSTTNKPIVILLHGHGGSFDQSIGAEFTKAPQKVWLDLAKVEEFIAVVANGTLGPEDTRGWNDCRSDAPGNPNTDDVAFISQLLDRLASDLNYDSDRIYISGVSNGASMAIRLAMEIPQRITAFASVITTMATNSECGESNVPVSALFMNGTADLIAPYDGGQIVGRRGLVQSTAESINYWIARNNTSPTPVKEAYEDIDQNDNSTVEKFLYQNGDNNSEVALIKVTGGGHTEPSLVEKYSNLYLGIVGGQNYDIEMANEVWNFFKTKSK